MLQQYEAQWNWSNPVTEWEPVLYYTFNRLGNHCLKSWSNASLIEIFRKVAPLAERAQCWELIHQSVSIILRVTDVKQSQAKYWTQKARFVYFDNSARQGKCLKSFAYIVQQHIPPHSIDFYLFSMPVKFPFSFFATWKTFN